MRPCDPNGLPMRPGHALGPRVEWGRCGFFPNELNISRVPGATMSTRSSSQAGGRSWVTTRTVQESRESGAAVPVAAHGFTVVVQRIALSRRANLLGTSSKTRVPNAIAV